MVNTQLGSLANHGTNYCIFVRAHSLKQVFSPLRAELSPLQNAVKDAFLLGGVNGHETQSQQILWGFPVPPG